MVIVICYDFYSYVYEEFILGIVSFVVKEGEEIYYG